YSAENAKVNAEITGSFSSTDDSKEYTVTLTANGETVDEYQFTAETNGGIYTIEGEDVEWWDSKNRSFTVSIPLITKESIYEALDEFGTNSLTFKVSCTNGAGNGSWTAKKYKVSVEAICNGRKVTNPDKVEFDPNPPTVLLLKDDQSSISIDYSGLAEDGYTIIDEKGVEDIAFPSDTECTVTVRASGKDNQVAQVIFGVDDDFIEINDLYDGHKIGLNCWSREFEYELFGCTEDQIKSVKLGNTPLYRNSGYVMEGDVFRFKAPSSVGAGSKILSIIREGGAEKKYKIQIVDPKKIVLTIDDPITTFEGYDVIVTPTVSGGAKLDGYELDDGGSEHFEASEKTSTSFIVSGISQGTGKLIVTPHFDVDMYESSDSDEPKWVGSTAKVTVQVVEAEDLDIDDVYVINGMKIKLSKFVDGYDSSMSSLPVTVTLDSKAKNLISVSSGTLGKVEITGKTSGTREDGISVFLSTADVTVYPKPSISLDSSSTSSSSSSYSNASYKFTAKMPAGDYHDDWMVSSLGTVEFTVISSSGEEKSLKKTSSYSSSSSNDSKIRSFTTTITAREMADALGKSSDSVKIRAYAYDGDKRDDKVYAEYSLSYNTGSSSSSSSSSSSKSGGAAGEGGSGSEYDDVPKTGESKTDIWVLWTVLFIAILGAGFMIYKRFGLVRAIAEADEEFAAAEHEERVEAARKEKEDKINMLKDLRNL
ncbi:MAG: hypothetical protein J5367_08895, partial [Lachnospiraceae bacterium]|nr:hypothetical protein [Lachnospiraceae bacterium]